MTDEERLSTAARRYEAACHAMQSGVAGRMADGRRDPATEPKHLRVGVNSALVAHAALVKLLVSMNIFKDVEYVEALADGMEAEKATYEKELSELYGKPVTLA